MQGIKIRMWSNNANKYFYNKDSFECLVQQIRFNEGYPFLGVPFDHVKDGMSFEQFTGLKDKTGKDIYEGDIVVWHSTEGDHSPPQPIKYNSDFAAFEIGPLPVSSIIYSGFYQPGTGCSDFEIIGNIHENCCCEKDKAPTYLDGQEVCMNCTKNIIK